MQQEIPSLFVRYIAIRVVRILPLFEIDLQPLVFRSIGVSRQIIVEPLASDQEGKSAMGGRVEALLEQTFDVGRPAFVEPKVPCIGLSARGARGNMSMES